MTLRDNNFLNITWLCKYACVSRSGYYRWLKANVIRLRWNKLERNIFLKCYHKLLKTLDFFKSPP